jgi:redox-sensing transcriptional repressor
MREQIIPPATVARLPLYLRALADMDAGQRTCSSDEIAVQAGVNPAQVRKDLSFLEPPGVRGVGYKIALLRDLLRHELGLTRTYKVAIAGAGNLGTALTLYPGFVDGGFEIVALLDTDPAKVGTEVNAVPISAMEDLEQVVVDRGIEIGIIATPAAAAQSAADRLVASGVHSILNFAPAVLKLDDHVHVRRVDLSTELQILAYHHRTGGDARDD